MMSNITGIISDSICNLTELESLGLSKNQINSFPTSIGNFKSLITLNLRRNWFTSVPEIICSLTSLKHLNLGGINRCRGVPGRTRSVSSIREISFLKKISCYILEPLLKWFFLAEKCSCIPGTSTFSDGRTVEM